MLQRPIIALYGSASEKNVDGKKRLVIPFLGAHDGHIGIGFMLPSTFSSNDTWMCTIWCLALEDTTLHAWRCMKMLEKVECIDLDSLCACWTASAFTVHQHDERDDAHLCKLSNQNGGVFAFRKLQICVQGLLPSDDEIDTMVANLLIAGIAVDIRDVRKAANEAHLALSPLIQRLTRKLDIRQLKLAQHALHNEPLIHTSCPELDDFCDYVRVVGIMSGDKDMNWHYIELGELRLLNEIASLEEMQEYLSEKYRVAHMHDEVKVFYGRIAHGVVEQPTLTVASGNTFAFRYAHRVDGRLLIHTSITHNGVLLREGEFPFGVIRAMIGHTYSRPEVRSFCGFLK
jgi:hypothetical protein